jgi:hypothetical protein
MKDFMKEGRRRTRTRMTRTQNDDDGWWRRGAEEK